MRSLRARLTFAYAVPTALLLCIVSAAITYLALQFLTRPIVEAIASSAAKARTIVAAHPNATSQVLQSRIQDEVNAPGVVVFVSRQVRVHVPFLRLPDHAGERFGFFTAGPKFGLFTEPQPPMLRSHGAPPPAPNLLEANIRSLLVIHGEFIPLRDGGVMIAPDLHLINERVKAYLEFFGAAVVLSLILSWFIGRAIAGAAIAPLMTVTGELRRFARGDFTPATIRTNDRSELGELAQAYSGAAAKVAEAFNERERLERHMRRFVADAGHELRTPLTAISGFIEVLERGGAEQWSVRARAFVTLKKETRRMYALVERLIALSRLERLEHVAASEIDLCELVADVVDSARMARAESVTLCRCDPVRVYADRSGVQDAIANLVDNALKYGAGSAVAVEVVDEGATAAVRVVDGGPGIPEQERSLIFERFYRGEGRAGIDGSGLGLSIAARAAELAGGSVVLESAEPGNTAFAVRLPVMTRTSRTRRTSPVRRAHRA